MNDINGLTGCINFYNIRIVDLEIISSGSKCEDAINIINSDGLLSKVEIENSYSDGLDVDFSNLSFRNVIVKNSLNDCVDLSFGNYFIEKIEVNNCGDKGLSVGETSVVKMKNLVSKNAKIGLASKDYSKVFSQSIQAYDTETCISAYKKKK